ncbi:MAG: YbaN family protein [Hyphomicrobiaceae bacterium]
MLRIWLILLGVLATVLAIAGAVLPGLPTTPFVIVALWAFARSSPRLHAALERIPLLRQGLAEAHRFEQRRAIRLPIKLMAMAMAWGSVAVTIYFGGVERVWLIAGVVLAALSGTVAMIWIPTDAGE